MKLLTAVTASALVVMSCTQAIGQGPAPHLVTPGKADVYTPVVIQWDSDPAGIYTVDYSVGLNGEWRTVETGFPSQGSSTRWTDPGNPDPTAFRFSSGDPIVPYRFYRLSSLLK
jgi:hypothetical protein